jgi:hypothetical protein
MSMALENGRFARVHRFLRFGAKVGGLVTGFVAGQGSRQLSRNRRPRLAANCGYDHPKLMSR